MLRFNEKNYDATSLELIINIKYWLTTLAGFGMPLFFILSGFVIHYNYRNKITRGSISDSMEFLWSRFSRLYPLFIFVLIIDIISNGGFSTKIYISKEDALDEIRALPYFLVFVQSWFYEVIGKNALIYQLGWNSPVTWSISTEWFFYLSYLLLAYPIVFFTHNRPAKYILLFIFSWIIIFYFSSFQIFNQINLIDDWAINKYGQVASMKESYQDSFVRWVFYFSPYARIGEFITGCLVSSLYIKFLEKKITKFEDIIGFCLTWMSLISLPIFLYLMYSQTNSIIELRKVRDNIGLAPPLAILIFCVARYENLVSRFLSLRSVVGMGNASYSIYLIHMLVFYLILKSIAFVDLPGTLSGFLFGITRLILALILIILFSQMLFKIVEVPAREWLRNLWVDNGQMQWRVILFTLGVFSLSISILAILKFFDSSNNSNSEIIIDTATYGSNCGAPKGNANWHILSRCGKTIICKYRIDVRNLGDPASGCGKDFRVEYRCKNGLVKPPIVIQGESGFGSEAILNCSDNIEILK